MWACCDDISSDDDEHNTSNAFVLLGAKTLIALVLLAGLADVDGITVAMGCRFALDVSIVVQQDHLLAVHDSLDHDLGMHFDDEMAVCSQVTAFSAGGRARSFCLASLLVRGFMKVHANLTSLLSFVVRTSSLASFRAASHVLRDVGPRAPGVRTPVRRVRGGTFVVTIFF